MKRRDGPRLIFAIALALALVAGACDGDDDAADTTTTTASAETTTTTGAADTTTTTTMAPEPEPTIEVPFLAQWEESGHNDAEAEAFVHWNEDDPAVVPATCAKCHSTPGNLDFLGADGSAFGTVDADHPVGTTIQCVACHNEVTISLDTVVMPSGIELTGLGDESRCMNCHQGRTSMFDVDEAVATAGVDDDTVSEDLGFLNIHYYAAAATKYGTEAKGGYEYEGNTYDAFFTHVEGYSTCIQCHDPHTLELKVDECATCHTGVAAAEDLRDVRMPGSLVDYDGDGDLTEGIYYEIDGVRGLLYVAMQRYSAEVAGSPIVYDSAAYPYFFNDLNANGEIDPDEADYGNRYATWTPRLLKAAYNYQVASKDPGAYAHGGKYIIQLVVDSTADLNTVLSDPVALDAVRRIDHGHFAGSEEAFRHWDEDDPAVVSGSCSRCHSAEGLPLFLEQGVTINQAPSNGFLCATCHADLGTFERHMAESVTFPSGLTVDSGDPDGNLCMTCHQGRESTASVNAAIGTADPDAVTEGLRFRNIHYFAAGATLFGNEAQGAYQYAGQEYLGRFAHVESYDICTECHGAHTLDVKVEECGVCHSGVETREDLGTIRMDPTDWDGDGDTTEGIAGEVATIADLLYTAIQEYAAATDGADPIIYDAHSYPYYFADLDGDGALSEGDSGYSTWTPRLLSAAYNYQYSQKDPGAFAHNGKYVLQILYDSLNDIGGDTTGMTRP
jgi:hypothetical protein